MRRCRSRSTCGFPANDPWLPPSGGSRCSSNLPPEGGSHEILAMNLLRFDSRSSWVRGVVSWWRDRLRTNPQLTMCLPTGLTPLPIYAEMVESVRAGRASFSQASVWSLDEFGDIAPDDPGRLTNTLRRHLVD